MTLYMVKAKGTFLGQVLFPFFMQIKLVERATTKGAMRAVRKMCEGYTDLEINVYQHSHDDIWMLAASTTGKVVGYDGYSWAYGLAQDELKEYAPSIGGGARRFV